MSNELDDFVRKNRESFDDKEPSDKVWNNINNNLFVGRKTSLWNSVTIWRVAAMLFMGLSLYLLLPKLNIGNKQNVAVLNEFKDVETFYIKQISQKTELIEEFQKSEGLNGFTHDFKQLEAMYIVLKEEMKSRPSKKVKDALVLNLLVRIDLLNQQLQKLEEGEHNEQSEEKEEDVKKNV